MTAALQLRGVTHAFGDRVALEGFSLEVASGEVAALIGFNGAGKTTALRVLTGRLHPDVGEAGILGADPARLPRELALRFGQAVDAPLVYPELSVRENLRCAALLHGLPRATVDHAVRRAVSRLDLDPWRDSTARSLSQGNLQRVGVAAAVVHRPSAVVLDEPTSALDPRGVVLVRALVRELAGDGCAVLVSSHHLDEVSRVADRILVAHRGRLIGSLQAGQADLERRFFDMVLADDQRRHATATARRGENHA